MVWPILISVLVTPTTVAAFARGMKNVPAAAPAVVSSVRRFMGVSPRLLSLSRLSFSRPGCGPDRLAWFHRRGEFLRRSGDRIGLLPRRGRLSGIQQAADARAQEAPHA